MRHLSPYPLITGKSRVLTHFELLQFVLQLLSGMEDSALHCPHGYAELFSDFIVMEAVEEHGEGLPKVKLQTVDRSLDVVNVDQGGHRIMVVILTRIQEILVFGLVNNCILETLPLVIVDENVPHDGVQPSFDVRPLLEIVLVTQRFYKGLLNQIIGIFSVTGETHCET